MALELARPPPPPRSSSTSCSPASTAGRCSQRLRTDPATAGIPVVVVSVVDDRARGTELGAAAYLVKPLDRDELVTTLRSVGALPRGGGGDGLMGTATVLVVEDNRLNMKLVRDVLEHAGYDVVGATTGEEGVELAVRDRPDLVLMDLQLPGIDGTEALRRIQRTLPGAAMPVVAVTASAMPSDREAAARAGFDGFLEKRSTSGPCPPRSPRSWGSRRDRAPHDPRRRRRAAEPPAPRGRARAPGTHGPACRVGSRVPGGAQPACGRPGAARRGDARARRLRGVPAPPGRGAHGVPAGGDDHRERRRSNASWRSRPARTTSSASRSTPASCSRGWRPWEGSSATRTPSPPSAAELAAWNRELEDRVEEQVREIERMRRLRRFLSPSSPRW